MLGSMTMMKLSPSDDVSAGGSCSLHCIEAGGAEVQRVNDQDSNKNPVLEVTGSSSCSLHWGLEVESTGQEERVVSSCMAGLTLPVSTSTTSQQPAVIVHSR